MSGDSLEAPESDAVEREAEVTPVVPPRSGPGVPLEVDPADAADQAREVALDEDEDYR
ncbi:MAG TPA: hypothetical protein VHU92_09300 [Streptosporangiaceae bacterium]|jgi:hypothetical protein|nr:hypothetical protein [Streptosporangiaceae bacterium]